MLTGLRSWLMKHVEHKDIGWSEIGETFTRFVLVRTRWFSVYLHYLDAPSWHPQCHDHPWGFVAFLLWRGYLERVGNRDYRRRPGSILFRPATFAHNVITPYGPSWSLIIAGRKARDWDFLPCERQVTNA